MKKDKFISEYKFSIITWLVSWMATSVIFGISERLWERINQRAPRWWNGLWLLIFVLITILCIRYVANMKLK